MRRVPKLWRGWAIGVAALWVAAFTLLPAPEVPAPVARPVERWDLPAQPERRNLDAAATAFARSPLWGAGSTADAQAPREDTRWAVAGIFMRGGEAVRAVVRFAAAKPTQTLAVGDELPDGSKIVTIEPSRVCAVKNRKRECLSVPAATRPDF